MYKMIIADDEEIMRDALKAIINKSFPDIHIVGEAETGREAIELAFEHVPHLMIMDIKMPGIDGLEAISEIKQRYPETRFIVVSAYDEFNYASDALKLGVDEYILKPVKRDKVIEAIGKIIRVIDDIKNKKSKELELKEKLNTLLPMLESEFVYSLIFGDMEKIKNIDYPKLLGISFDAGFCMVISLKDSSYPERVRNALEKSYLNHKIMNIVRAYLAQNHSCIISPIISGRIMIFFSVDGNADSYKTRIWSIDVAKELLEKIKEDTEISANIGIGEYYTCINRLTDSYNEALTALSYSSEMGRIVYYGDVEGRITHADKYPIQYEKELCEKIKLGDVDGAIEAFKEFFLVVKNNAKGNMTRVNNHLFEVIVVVSRILYEYKGEENAALLFGSNIREELSSLKTQSEAFQWCINKISYAASEISSIKKKHVHSIITEAIDFMESHFSEEITLESVARKVAVSPYYLSKLFKSEKEQNFIDYLTCLRIEKAKELLSNDLDTSIKEICFKVGYNDPKYFSKVFKKYTGISPIEYREGHK